MKRIAWLTLGLLIAWLRKPTDDNDLPDAEIRRMWQQGTPVTFTTPFSPYCTIYTTTASNNASVTYGTKQWWTA